MTTNHRMEGLSRAYLQAVGAQAGANLQYQVTDYGIDFSLREITRIRGRYVDTATVIDVQLRSTTRVRERPTGFGYDLDVRTYNFLRRERVLIPRLLLLLVLPDREDQWLMSSDEGLTLRRCMYWLSLLDHPDSRARSSVRVTVPRANRFDVPALRGLFDRCRLGVPL